MEPRPTAQTEAQLLRQVSARGWSEADQDRLVRAHGLAARIFDGRSRVTGKPFLGHVVRTASFADDAGERPDVVLAALLHSAYSRGDFGDGTTDITPDKRAAVASASGGDVEPLVHGYTTFPFGYKAVAALTRRAALEPHERDLLAMRLANLLDELLEREHWNYTNPEQWVEIYEISVVAARQHDMDQIARRVELGLVADNVVRPKRRHPRGLRRFTRRAMLRRRP